MTILVTGAAGYVGNNTVRRLVKAGKPVRALVRNADKAKKRLGDIADQVEIVEGDVTERDSLRPAMQDISAVIHLVAISMEKGGNTYEEINYQGTINVVDMAEEAGVGRFIYMSQNGASSDLPYRFLKSKGRAQDYVMEFARNWTVIRPSAIFGAQDEFFNTFARLAKITPIVFPLVGGGKAEFQPISVYDVAEVIARSLEDDSTIGKALDIGGPEVLTLGEIERRTLKAIGARRIFFPAPKRLLRAPVWIMEKTLPGSPVNGSLLELLAVKNTVPDNALVTHFGMDPIPYKGEHLAYLRDVTIGGALRKFFTGATVN